MALKLDDVLGHVGGVELHMALKHRYILVMCIYDLCMGKLIVVSFFESNKIHVGIDLPVTELPGTENSGVDLPPTEQLGKCMYPMNLAFDIASAEEFE